MDEPSAPFAHVLFAFALYGPAAKYTRGMIKNCEMLAEHFPGCRVGIALGDDVPPEIVRALEEICGHVVLVKLGFSGAAAMAERMFLLEEDPAFADCTVVFLRDADSRVHSRDRSCIRAFLDEGAGGEGAGHPPATGSLRHLAHTIRDHIYHTQPIMGGLFGLRREGLDGLIGGRLRPRYRAFLEACGCSSGYGTDERFLADVVHPLVQEALLVHTDLWQAPPASPVPEFDSQPCHPVPPASFAPLPAPLSSEHEFCGNVVEVGVDSAETPAFSYCEPPLAHIAKSSPRACVNLLCHTLANDLGPLSRMLRSFPSSQRYAILWDMLTAVYQLEACALLPASFFQLWETTHVDEAIILYSNHYIQKAYTRIVGTSTGGQEGAARSCLVIVYCNTPMDCRNLPCPTGVVYRHPAYVFSLTHTAFVSHPCWKPFGQIYVINLEERTDRFLEVMVELSRVHAPLDRVTHYRARKDGDRLSAYRGATKNHVDVLECIAARCRTDPEGRAHFLVLEDDITFTSLVSEMHRDLLDAARRLGTEYDILFLAASKFHEIRASQAAPSLLCVSRQECTTSSAYMVNASSVGLVLGVAREGYEGMVVEGRLDPERVHENCIDRYWSRLNPRDRMFIFRRKMAYQRPTYSNLTGKVGVSNFD